jgi:S1-C subfamily serine protease
VRDLPGTSAAGVIVESVRADSPAHDAGLTATPLVASSTESELQLIVGIDGTEVHVLVELELLLQAARGPTVTLRVRKGADEREVQVTLEPAS